MLLSIINNPNASVSMWQDFIEWFKSLYDIQFNFFGRPFALMNLIYWTGISSIVVLSFQRLFGFTQDVDENM